MSRVEIGGFQDPEESTQQLVVALWVELRAQDAMAYWNDLGSAIEGWANSLPESDAETLSERIALEVYSAVDDAAA